MSQVSRFTLYFVYLAIAEFLFIFVATFGFCHAGERIVRRLRLAYLESLVRQDIAFFDVLSTGSIITRITLDMNLVQESITSKLSLSLTAAATFITAFVVAFVEYWKLALILSSTIVVMLITGIAGAAYAIQYTRLSHRHYSNGATIAEETISTIRHVAAYGIQDTLAQRYLSHVIHAEAAGIVAGYVISAMTAIMQALPYLSYGLSFWQGTRFAISGEMSSSGVVTTTLAIVIGAFAISRVTPSFQAFLSGTASATGILEAISRTSAQDPFSRSGIKRSTVNGEIIFKDVSLSYPSRPDTVVFKNLDIAIPAGKTTAIVGASGCGKSSICELIQRFYEPSEGHIRKS
jgi:ATP-binding cassette, subfamily B (MDR/TAP), member 1